MCLSIYFKFLITKKYICTFVTDFSSGQKISKSNSLDITRIMLSNDIINIIFELLPIIGKRNLLRCNQNLNTWFKYMNMYQIQFMIKSKRTF